MVSGEIHDTAYSCEKKLCLLFADEDFSIDDYIQKAAFNKLQFIETVVTKMVVKETIKTKSLAKVKGQAGY